MKNTNRSGGNSVWIAVIAFCIGALFGLVVLGWWLWPVTWVGGSLEAVNPAAQHDYLSAAVDSFARNSDLQLAERRFASLGQNKDAALYYLNQSPGTLSRQDIDDFAAALGAEDVLRRETAPAFVKPPATNIFSGLSGSSAWLVVIFMGATTLLLLLLLIGLIVRSRVQTGRLASEPPMVKTYDTPEELTASPGAIEATPVEVLEPEIEAGVLPDWLRETSETRIDEASSVEPLDAVEALTEEDFQQISGGDLLEMPVGAAINQQPELRDVAEETRQQVFEKFSRDIIYLPGISADEAASLRESGITVPLLLLKTGANPDGRKAIADQTGIDSLKILGLVELVDLLRVSGLTLEDAQVLQIVGVERLSDLAAQNPEQLAALIHDVRAEASLAYTLPSRELVEHWIIQANSLPKAII